jgi:hypothetical protein
MRQLNIIVWILIVAMISSCATKTLWGRTDPAQYVAVSSDVVSEAEMQKRGVKYIRNAQGNLFLIEKSDTEKLKDYTYRILGTPITIVIDASVAVIIVGGYVLNPEQFVGDMLSDMMKSWHDDSAVKKQSQSEKQDTNNGGGISGKQEGSR